MKVQIEKMKEVVDIKIKKKKGRRKKRTEIHKHTAEDAQVKRRIEIQSWHLKVSKKEVKRGFELQNANFEALCVEEVLPTHSWKLSTFILY